MKAKDLLKKKHPPKILLYGPAGTGKTALFSQAVEGFLMDFDNGMYTTLSLNDYFTEKRQNVEFETYTEQDVRKPTAWLKAKAQLIQIMEQCSKGQWKYKALVIDSLTGLSECVQAQVMAQCGKPMGKPEIREWGLIVAEVENAINIIKSLPIPVFMTAHELPIQKPDGSHVLKILAPGTKLPAKIPGWFDEVWYAKTRQGGGGKTSYIVSGRKTSSIEARTRSGMNKDLDHTTIGLEGVLKEIGLN